MTLLKALPAAAFLLLVLTPGLLVAAQPAHHGSGTTAIEPQPGLVALDGPADTLRYDGDNHTGGGLQGGGWFKTGVRFTAPFRCIVNSVLFYQYDRALPGYIFRYGHGTESRPGPLWDSTQYYPHFVPDTGWVHTEMPVERFVPAGTDFWAAVEFATAPGDAPIGMDRGPRVPDRNFLYIWEHVGWEQLSLNHNFNIRAIVSRAESRDVTPVAVVAPGVQTWPVPAPVRVRIRNVGEHPAADIPVTVRIDSAGTMVYDQTVTLPGPVAPRQYGLAELPTWQPGPVGAEYEITAFTAMTDDEHRANDTLRATTLVTEAAFADTFRVNRIAADPPTIDGVIEPGEWRAAAAYDVSDLAGRGILPRPAGSGIIRFLYDDAFLYLACEFPTVGERADGDHFAVCIDQDRSGTWNRADSSEGRHTVLFAGTDSVIFEALLTTLPYTWRLPGQCPDAHSASSTAGGRLQFEARLRFGDRRSDLKIQPGDTVGLFLYSMAENGSSYYGWWPQHITSGNWADPSLYSPLIFEPEVGLADRPGRHGPTVLDIRPNPVRHQATIRLPSGSTYPGLRIYNRAGMLVRDLRFSDGSATGILTWDCTDDRGRRVPAGVYLVRPAGPEGGPARALLVVD